MPIFNTLSYEDGSLYTGGVVKGQKQGKGRIQFANGNIYEGEFYNDNFEGSGIKIFYNIFPIFF
jgi:hypothetical protein